MSRSRLWLLVWGPTVLGLVVCIYLSYFALDSIRPGPGVRLSLTEIAVQLIPTLVLLVIIALSWRWQLIGVVVFGCLTLAYTFMARSRPSWIPVIAGPLLVVALAYLFAWWRLDDLDADAAPRQA